MYGKTNTTMGVGGEFKCYFPQSVSEAVALLRENPLWILGGGSNLLILDEGAKDALSFKNLQKVKIEGERVFAEAGFPLSKLAKLALNKGLSGLEFATSIPGTAGGAVFGNAGAFGQDICSLIQSVTVIQEGEIKVLDLENLKFGYRKGIEKTILSVQLKLSYGDKSVMEKRIDEYKLYRRKTQPVGKTFGSVFKRYKGISPAVYIEKTGLKGMIYGGAKISEKHCNFIINEKGATSQDVLYLVKTIEDKVGVPLEREFRIPPK